MHKRQKIETSDIVVSCTFVSPHQIDQRGQFYLLKFADGVLRLLTPHWDFLSNPVDEAYVKQHMPVASNIVVKPGFAFIKSRFFIFADASYHMKFSCPLCAFLPCAPVYA